MWVLETTRVTDTIFELYSLCLKRCCCGYSKQHPPPHVRTGEALRGNVVGKLLCTRNITLHKTIQGTHFGECCCCGETVQHPQDHTTTDFVKLVLLWVLQTRGHNTRELRDCGWMLLLGGLETTPVSLYNYTLCYMLLLWVHRNNMPADTIQEHIIVQCCCCVSPMNQW